jgi:hypothetical protein
MGIDRRTWMQRPAGGPRVTGNLDALLLENQALRQEVQALRQQLARLRTRDPGITTGAAPGLTPPMVQAWGEAMARHPRWRELRLGCPPRAGRSGEGLEGLIAERLPHGGEGAFDPGRLLERRWPGLGRELRWALQGPRSRVRLAVWAAFALHGPQAAERLAADPAGVVEELLAAIERLEAPPQPPRNAEPPRTAEPSRNAEPRRTADPQRSAACRVLGLHPDASHDDVKAAHRRLVKRHHPDLGGDPEIFRRIDAAYRLLTA